ncbi:unnamed protein product [Cuscuta campestris]|uniref:Uncharacterized protein n=1 Tax=Cuscuta campestris TaxID=132261 RepID=A0A484LQH0_9ASTE|nr:unnamed protein product [Cuscuta campestris]
MKYKEQQKEDQQKEGTIFATSFAETVGVKELEWKILFLTFQMKYILAAKTAAIFLLLFTVAMLRSCVQIASIVSPSKRNWVQS